MILSICTKHTWKITNVWFFRVALFVCIYTMVSFFPKPRWACYTNAIKDSKISAVTSFSPKAVDVNSLGKGTTGFVHDVIDPHVNRILQFFPLYLEQNSQVDLERRNTQALNFHSNTSLVKVFNLQNFNFSHFGRTWLNTISKHELRSQHLKHADKNQVSSEFILKKLQHQKLPDCVKLKVPHGATSTKICVHYSKDDNFISNRLRDMGIWEIDLVFQMEEFFRNNPRSQLIDLGCNVGVFTLFAASLAKPVLAVDILPSNLALIQLSIAINDENLKQANEDADEVQQLLGYNKKYRPKYSDLITTVHNAIYSRHVKMYVYLKEDLNLGGTEVKEVNIQEENTHVHSSDVVHTKRNPKRGMPTEIVTDMLDIQSPSTTTNNTKIIVDAVCLDDLIPYVQTNLSIFLKMDIEGSEPNVFLCANKFFMHVDIRVILMEILFHRYSDQGKMMVNFLLRHNMLPFEDVAGRKLLNVDLNNMYKWPENMFWIKVR